MTTKKTKNNNTPTRYLYQPHEYQRAVHNELQNGKATFVTVVSGRQGGKTKLAEMQVIWWATSNKCKLIWVVSPTDRQSKRIFRNIFNAISTLQKDVAMRLVVKKNNSAGNISIEFFNETRIEFVSASSEDNLRGSSVDFLLLDEGAFIPSRIVEDVILPTMIASRSRCKVLVTTTPKGNNWVKEWFDLGTKTHPQFDPNYASFRWSSFDSPYTNKDMLNQLARKLTQRQVEQEINANFVDVAGVFTRINVAPKSTLDQECYAGIDVGIVNDATVIHILDREGKTKHIERLVGQNPSVIKRTIKDLFRGYKVRRGYIETNNQGIAIYRDLCEEGMYDTLQAWTTSNSSKEEIVGALVLALENDLTTIISDPPEAIQEYHEFTYDFTKGGKLKYAAGRGHDDCVMAHAIAYRAYQDFGPSKSDFNPDNIMMISI